MFTENPDYALAVKGSTELVEVIALWINQASGHFDESQSTFDMAHHWVHFAGLVRDFCNALFKVQVPHDDNGPLRCQILPCIHENLWSAPERYQVLHADHRSFAS